MRLIDLDTLLQFLESQNCANDWLVNMYNADWIASWLESQPIIEIEVVRCKDCRYNFRNNGHDKDGCPIVDSTMWLGENGFCSGGERRDSDGNL